MIVDTNVGTFLVFQAADEISKLYEVFLKHDLVQLEINPFASTDKGVISVDAKLQVDENAKFRQVKCPFILAPVGTT